MRHMPFSPLAGRRWRQADEGMRSLNNARYSAACLAIGLFGWVVQLA